MLAPHPGGLAPPPTGNPGSASEVALNITGLSVYKKAKCVMIDVFLNRHQYISSHHQLGIYE